MVIENVNLGLCENAALPLVSDARLYTLLSEHRDAHCGVLGRDWATVPDPTFSVIESSPDYCGPCQTCSRGEVGCAANFCWKQDGQVMVFLETSGSDLVVAQLLAYLKRGSTMGYWPPK